MSWQSSVIGIGFIAGTNIQGLIVLNNPDYVFERWHGTLLTIAISAFCTIFNVTLAKHLPLVETLLCVLHVVGLLAVIIPLWVLAPRNDTNVAFLQIQNNGDWPTVGLSFMIGLFATLGSMMGFDCAVHMGKYLYC